MANTLFLNSEDKLLVFSDGSTLMYDSSCCCTSAFPCSGSSDSCGCVYWECPTNVLGANMGIGRYLTGGHVAMYHIYTDRYQSFTVPMWSVNDVIFNVAAGGGHITSAEKYASAFLYNYDSEFTAPGLYPKGGLQYPQYVVVSEAYKDISAQTLGATYRFHKFWLDPSIWLTSANDMFLRGNDNIRRVVIQNGMPYEQVYTGQLISSGTESLMRTVEYNAADARTAVDEWMNILAWYRYPQGASVYPRGVTALVQAYGGYIEENDRSTEQEMNSSNVGFDPVVSTVVITPDEGHKLIRLCPDWGVKYYATTTGLVNSARQGQRNFLYSGASTVINPWITGDEAIGVQQCPEYWYVFIMAKWWGCINDTAQQFPVDTSCDEFPDFGVEDAGYAAPIPYQEVVVSAAQRLQDIAGEDVGFNTWFHEDDENPGEGSEPMFRPVDNQKDTHGYYVVPLNIACYPGWYLNDRCVTEIDGPDYDVPHIDWSDELWSQVHTVDACDPPSIPEEYWPENMARCQGTSVIYQDQPYSKYWGDVGYISYPGVDIQETCDSMYYDYAGPQGKVIVLRDFSAVITKVVYSCLALYSYADGTVLSQWHDTGESQCTLTWTGTPETATRTWQATIPECMSASVLPQITGGGQVDSVYSNGNYVTKYIAAGDIKSGTYYIPGGFAAYCCEDGQARRHTPAELESMTSEMLLRSMCSKDKDAGLCDGIEIPYDPEEFAEPEISVYISAEIEYFEEYDGVYTQKRHEHAPVGVSGIYNYGSASATISVHKVLRRTSNFGVDHRIFLTDTQIYEGNTIRATEYTSIGAKPYVRRESINYNYSDVSTAQFRWYDAIAFVPRFDEEWLDAFNFPVTHSTVSTIEHPANPARFEFEAICRDGHLAWKPYLIETNVYAVANFGNSAGFSQNLSNLFSVNGTTGEQAYSYSDSWVHTDAFPSIPDWLWGSRIMDVDNIDYEFNDPKTAEGISAYCGNIRGGAGAAASCKNTPGWTYAEVACYNAWSGTDTKQHDEQYPPEDDPDPYHYSDHVTRTVTGSGYFRCKYMFYFSYPQAPANQATRQSLLGVNNSEEDVW